MTDGWKYRYDDSTFYVCGEHPKGGKRSICDLSWALHSDERVRIGTQIAEMLNTGYTKPRNPYLAVDVIIELLDYNNQIVLIERKNPPYGWALPGGFVDYGESLEDAAYREMQEEVQLDVVALTQLKAYSDPKRDPRQHIVSVAFVCAAKGTPVAADDAKSVRIVDPTKLLNTPLVCDHNQIIIDYLKEHH